MFKPLATITLVAAVAAAGFAAPARPWSTAAGAPDEKGTVTAISSASLSLRTAKGKTKTFRVTPSTTVGKLGDPARLSDVKQGSIVKVEYASTTDLTATSITIGANTSSGWLFSTKETGAVTGVYPDWLRLTKDSGKAIGIRFTPGTRFERLGQKITIADVKVGEPAKVKFDIAANGDLTATSVAVGVTSTSGIVYSDKQEGTLSAITPASVTVDPGNGKTVLSFRLTAGTQYDRLGSSSTLKGLKVGDITKVKFRVTPDGSLEAVSVSIGAKSVVGVLYTTKETGTIAAISPTKLTLRTKKGDTIPVRLASKTTFEKAGLPVKRTDLRVGDTAKTKFAIAADGSLVALSVSVGTRVAGKLSFPKHTSGTLRSLSPAQLTLRTAGGKTIVLRLTARTAFEKTGRKARRTDFKVGAKVTVSYQKRGTIKVAILVTQGTTRR